MSNLFDRLRGIGGKPKPPAEPARTKLEAELDREQARELVSRKVQTALEHFDTLIQKSTGIDHSIAAAVWAEPYAEINSTGGFRYETIEEGKKICYSLNRYDKLNEDKKSMGISIEYSEQGDGDFDHDCTTIYISLDGSRPGDYSNCSVERLKSRGKRHRDGETKIKLHIFDPGETGHVAKMTQRLSNIAKDDIGFWYKDIKNNDGITVVGGTLKTTDRADNSLTSKPITDPNEVSWGDKDTGITCRVQDGYLVVNTHFYPSSEDISFPMHTTIQDLLDDLAPGLFTPNLSSQKIS